MKCDFVTTDLGDGTWEHRCQRQGCEVTRVIDRPKLVRECNVVGLGDRVAWVLNKLGIRVRKKCNCSKRRQVLNAIGEKIRDGVSSLIR